MLSREDNELLTRTGPGTTMGALLREYWIPVVESKELDPGGRLEIAPAGRAITLLHPPGYDYFRLLRSKLHWGIGGLAHER